MRARLLLCPLLVLLAASCGGGESSPDQGSAETAGETAAPADGAPTEADVQGLITRREQASATGVGSMHSSATLEFHETRFGEPRPANERDRLVNGITGPTVYPVRVRYTSNRTWGNGQSEAKPIHYDYEFYREPMGEWNVYLVGPVR